MPQMTVAVVGAGIAGLALAAALRRTGIDVHVYEKTPQLSEVGAGLQLAPNATRVLHRLGLGDRLRAVSVAPEAIEIHRWDDGALLQRTLLGETCRRRFGAPYYTVHRSDLHSALLSVVPPGRVHLGARCTSVTQTADACRLHLADGTTIEADVVVGADGIHSIVRDGLVPDRPRYSGQTIYRGLVPAERVPYLLTRPRVRLWFGPGRHCVCYPVSSGRQVSFGATVPASDWQQESWSARGSVGDLVRAYTGWHEDVTRLIGAAEAVSRWALHDRDSVSVLAHGRVTLVGDAAHPMLPFRAQGANQAIEDAAALARCLTDAGSDGIAAALRHYEQVRLPRTGRLQRESRDSVRTFHLADGAAQQDRDAAASATAGSDHQDWLFGYDAEQAVAMQAAAETPA
jgi:salicylate hydroxylase